MTPKEIKIRLIEHDITHRELAESLGVSCTAIHNVINGISRSKRIMEAVINATNGIRPGTTNDSYLKFPEIHNPDPLRMEGDAL